MKLDIINIEGKKTGKKAELSDSVFKIEDASEHLVWQDVRLILANRRQGTHKTKEKGELAFSTKKPFRQKGTGGARAGTKKSPLWRHGGTVFGPRPRDYGFKMNKKAKAKARASALTVKARENNIQVLEKFNFEEPKTKSFLAMLRNLELGGKKVLLVLPEDNKNIYLSGRNIPKTKVVRAGDLNTYDIMNADQLVIMDEAVPVIEKNILKN